MIIWYIIYNYTIQIRCDIYIYFIGSPLCMQVYNIKYWTDRGRSNFDILRNWAFTENDIITSSKGNVTLRVEGCPREQFNGDYVQDRESLLETWNMGVFTFQFRGKNGWWRTFSSCDHLPFEFSAWELRCFRHENQPEDGKYYNHRPTFYCRENDYCMFYHAENKQWSIFWRVSPQYSSCRVKTSRGPHMAGQAWSVWSPKDKAFVKSPQMVCRLLTVEELIALAPDTILMNSEQIAHCWFEAPGAVGSKRNTAAGHNECFKKTEEMKNGRPVYQAWNEKYNRLAVTTETAKHYQTPPTLTCLSDLSRPPFPIAVTACAGGIVDICTTMLRRSTGRLGSVTPTSNENGTYEVHLPTAIHP